MSASKFQCASYKLFEVSPYPLLPLDLVPIYPFFFFMWTALSATTCFLGKGFETAVYPSFTGLRTRKETENRGLT